MKLKLLLGTLLLLCFITQSKGTCELKVVVQPTLNDPKLPLQFTITNQDKVKGVCILKWNTLLEDELWPIAISLFEGNNYIKPLQRTWPIRVGKPDKIDYLYLNPGRSHTITRALFEHFQFKKNTYYFFQVETKPEDCYVASTCLGKAAKYWQTSRVQGGDYESPTFKSAKRNGRKSMDLQTWVKNKKVAHQNTGKVYQIGKKLLSIEFSAVVKAHQLATLMLQDAVTALQTKKHNSLYTQWFGGTSTCKKQVLDNFNDFLRQAKDEEFFYQVLPDELGKKGWIAAVDGMLTGKEQHFINLYKLFFTAKDKYGFMPQNEYQAMTILHEITHDVAGTQDVTYDPIKCQQLTKKKLKGVTEATDNAENYALYATAVYNLLHPAKPTTSGSGMTGQNKKQKRTKRIKKPRTMRKRSRSGTVRSGKITPPKKKIKKNPP